VHQRQCQHVQQATLRTCCAAAGSNLWQCQGTQTALYRHIGQCNMGACCQQTLVSWLLSLLLALMLWYAGHQLRQQLASDPYIEWWSLKFDPAAESRAHDHLSSLHYMPVMLQVCCCCALCRLQPAHMCCAIWPHTTSMKNA
jgi:hypothetical protein